MGWFFSHGFLEAGEEVAGRGWGWGHILHSFDLTPAFISKNVLPPWASSTFPS